MHGGRAACLNRPSSGNPGNRAILSHTHHATQSVLGTHRGRQLAYQACSRCPKERDGRCWDSDCPQVCSSRGERRERGVELVHHIVACQSFQLTASIFSDDEATTVVKSSSGSNPRTESDPKDRKDTESADIESSLLQPTHNRQASSAPGSVIRSRATRDAPPSTGAKVVTAGGKRAGKGKGIRGRRMTSHDVEDDESSPKVSSRSRSGRGGGVVSPLSICMTSPPAKNVRSFSTHSIIHHAYSTTGMSNR